MITPTQFKPAILADLIGPAAAVGRILESKILRLRADPGATLKAMFYGAPGVGKTELARLLAAALGNHPFAIEEVSGLRVNVELVKDWMSTAGVGALFGDWQVKVVHEMDRIPTAAQDLLLHYLDTLPPRRAFIGTSNLQMDLLQERFQTRMQTWKVEGPSTEEIIAFITDRWPIIPRQIAAQIAVGCGGNVRAALLDTESQLDVQLAA